eukprot:2374736-Prymnesium_polylepis.4
MRGWARSALEADALSCVLVAAAACVSRGVLQPKSWAPSRGSVRVRRRRGYDRTRQFHGAAWVLTKSS